MPKDKEPKLHTVEKVKPPYPLNGFPKEFAFRLGKEIVYLLATKGTPDLRGSDWEQIFALCIGGKWTPSNVGLDDVTFHNCAWSAKSVKSNKPENATKVRLISGRNSPTYSFGELDILNIDPTNWENRFFRFGMKEFRQFGQNISICVRSSS